jgi:hypothetical protein
MTNKSTLADLATVSLPAEMRGMDIKPGSTWSIHHYGEEAGTAVEWDGRTAEELIEDDAAEAAEQGCGDAKFEVTVLLILADSVVVLDTASR